MEFGYTDKIVSGPIRYPKEFVNLNPTTQQGFDPQEVCRDFVPVLKLLKLSVVFPNYGPTLKPRSGWRKVAADASQLIINVLSVYIFVICALCLTRFSRSFSMNFSISTNTLLAICLRLAIFQKRNAIIGSIVSLAKFYSNISTDSYRPLYGRIVVLTITITAVGFGLSVLGIINLEIIGSLHSYAGDYIFRQNVSMEGLKNETLPKIALSFFVVCHFYMLIMPLSALMLCCCAYFTLWRSIHCFATKLRRNIIEGFNENDVLDYIRTYNDMCNVVTIIDNMFSPFAVLQYGSILASQFCVLTQLLSESSNMHHPVTVTMEVLLSVKNVGHFLALTFMAASIADEGTNVRTEIRRMVEQSRHHGKDVRQALVMLQGITNDFKVTLTGWGMFHINKALILTTTGVLITYGLLLVQFGS